MGKIGKLIAGIIFLIVGVFIAYIAYSNNLIDIILILGGLIAIVGIIFIIIYFIDSSADQTRELFKDYVEKKSNIQFPDIKISGSQNKQEEEVQRGPLRIRREFDNYDEEFYGDDMTYVEEDENFNYGEMDDNPHRVLRSRNLEAETIDFGNNLNFTPNYDKPIKITRAPKKRDVGFFDTEEQYSFDVETDKSESIRQALSEDDDFIVPDLRAKQDAPRDIKIDINNPELLPIPKFLNSYIISNGQIVTSQDAFENLANKIQKEVMLEIPTLNELSDRFLSQIPTIYSRVIIEDFDVSNIAYMILVASLLKQGVQIRTLANVNTINFIVDDSAALILSKGRGGSEIEYGAIYDDINALSEIRGSFEKSWGMAKELDQDIILRYMEAGD